MDVVAHQPSTLAFGDPDNGERQQLHKTVWGGFSSVIFIIVMIGLATLKITKLVDPN